jgi:hypothetical protein
MDESNGCLRVYPKSHLFGTLHHERVIEDIFTGDNQLCIANMDIAIKPISLFAQKGDIIVFHNDLIHQSGSSTCNSKRLSLIAEVEFGDELKLDDYGLPAIHFKGNKNYYNSVILQFKSLFNPFRVWRLIKRYLPSLGRLIRRIRYK